MAARNRVNTAIKRSQNSPKTNTDRGENLGTEAIKCYSINGYDPRHISAVEVNTEATYEVKNADWLTDESGETSERAATDSPWLFGSGSRSLATKCMTVVLPSGNCSAAITKQHYRLQTHSISQILRKYQSDNINTNQEHLLIWGKLCKSLSRASSMLRRSCGYCSRYGQQTAINSTLAQSKQPTNRCPD